jgi:hypothetical protein
MNDFCECDEFMPSLGDDRCSGCGHRSVTHVFLANGESWCECWFLLPPPESAGPYTEETE